MDYEKKYKDALERAKNLYKDAIDMDDSIRAKQCEIIFPELKESEDEKMLREIKRYIKEQGDKPTGLPNGNVAVADMLAWLEKQKVTDEEIIFRPVVGTDIRIAAKQALEKIAIGKKVVLAFNGAYIPVNGKTVGEIDSEYDAWLKKQSDINETINRDEFAQGVLRGAAINLITWIDYNTAKGNMCLSNMECKVIEDALVSGDWDSIYAYIKRKLEKQGKSNFEQSIQDGDNVVTNEDGTHFNISQLERVAKKEPKFKVSDWIANNIETVQITGYDIDYGYQVNYKGNLQHRDTDIIEKEYHLWTIQDAKDGDVLYFSDDTIVIFKDLYNATTFHSYCHIEDGVFDVSEEERPDWWDSVGFKPASKEQRDLLFFKIKEADYEWDADKKELKKVEPKFKVGNWYQCTKDFFGKGVTFDKNTAYYCAKEGCLLDGCHIAIVKDLYDNFKLWTIQDAKDGDVVVDKTDGAIGIFQSIGHHPDGGSCNDPSYCFLHCRYDDGFFYADFEHGNTIDSDDLIPATKEQRDLLFQKMKEAGYEWDAEKKELNKIEPKSESKSAWSEEDEEMLENIIDDYDDVTEHNLSDDIGKVTWLESLKQRLKGE